MLHHEHYRSIKLPAATTNSVISPPTGADARAPEFKVDVTVAEAAPLVFVSSTVVVPGPAFTTVPGSVSVPTLSVVGRAVSVLSVSVGASDVTESVVLASDVITLEVVPISVVEGRGSSVVEVSSTVSDVVVSAGGVSVVSGAD